jgi:hypothetical protein
MRKLRPLIVAVAVLSPLPASLAFAQTAPAAAPAPSSGMPIELTTLKLLLAKGLITQAEYDSAMRDLADSAGMRSGDQGTVVVGKWATTIYGFIEADHIYDSTQSFSDVAGNGQVQRPNPGPLPANPAAPTRYAGEHGRLMFGVRNSRLGFRMKAPEVGGVRTSAQMELDLLGNQPGNPPAVTESSFFTNPAMRVRHAFMKIETPIVDVLIGQYWHLFGWQSVYHPNTVEIQGVPGQIYGRTPQIRLSKTLKMGQFHLELAGALMRPPQRDSEVPEMQGGIRFSHDGFNGLTTAGATGTSIMPISLAVTGDWRRFSLQDFSPTPTHTVDKSMTAIAIDAFIPVVPATKDKKGNSLSLNGEFVTGYGIADLYTGFAGGLTNPTIPNGTAGVANPTYTPNVDPNMVVFGPDGTLHGIQWTSYLMGVQYYLPGSDAKYWVSANYSHTQSANAPRFVRNNVAAVPTAYNLTYAGLVRESEDWFDFNVFGDVAPGVRIGLEYANFNDRYSDGVHAINHRLQASGFFLF